MSVLFLGNSHLSAYKFAVEEAFDHLDARFFAARGGDLAVTSLAGSSIIVTRQKTICKDSMKNFMIQFDENYYNNFTNDRRNVLESVERQFRITGGAGSIDLQDVTAIFYVAGKNPVDFMRWSVDRVEPRAYWERFMETVCGSRFLLRGLVSQIRKEFPDIAQYLVAAPLASTAGRYADIPRPAEIRSVNLENRRIIKGLTRNHLFDDIYIPSPSVLDKTLGFTRKMFAKDGRAESNEFQGAPRTISDPVDHIHMNKAYGLAVLKDFRAFDPYAAAPVRSVPEARAVFAEATAAV